MWFHHFNHTIKIALVETKLVDIYTNWTQIYNPFLYFSGLIFVHRSHMIFTCEFWNIMYWWQWQDQNSNWNFNAELLYACIFFDDSINFCETSCMHHIIAQCSVVVGYQNCVGSSVDSLSFILYRINVKKLLQSL